MKERIDAPTAVSAIAMGGLLAAAATSQRPGALDGDDDDENVVDNETSVFAMVETDRQTDENVEEAVELSIRTVGKLPPWAKPWTPAPVGVANPALTDNANSEATVVETSQELGSRSAVSPELALVNGTASASQGIFKGESR